MNQSFSIYHVIIIFLLVVANVYSLPMVLTLEGNVLLLVLSGGLFASGNNVLGNKKVFFILSLLTLYTLMVCLNANEVSIYTIGKPIRMLVVYVIFALMSRKLASYSYNEIATGLVVGLSVHLICVYLQFFIPTTKQFFFELLDTYEKEAITEHSLRAFGLCASFDAAGLSICVLMTLLWVLFKKNHNIFLLLLSMVALVACFMVGRTAMIVGSTFFILMLFSLFRNNKKYFVLSSIVFIAVAYYVWGIAMGILDNSIVEESYREESIDYLTDNMLYLPDSTFGAIYGTGQLPSNSDIGYIKIIHMIGFLGLSMVLYMYYITIKYLRRLKNNNTSVYVFMILLFALLIVYNYKLLLLYASGMNDLYFLLYFVFARKFRSSLVLKTR